MVHDCMIDMRTLKWDRSMKWFVWPSIVATQTQASLVIVMGDGRFRGNNFDFSDVKQKQQKNMKKKVDTRLHTCIHIKIYICNV